MMIVEGGNEITLFFMTDDRVEAFFVSPVKMNYKKKILRAATQGFGARIILVTNGAENRGQTPFSYTRE